MNEHNKLVIDAWITGRISLSCALASLEKEEDTIVICKNCTLTDKEID